MSMGDDLNRNQQERLLRLARQTIGSRLEGTGEVADCDDQAFQAWAATFVTLKIDGQLRGCIGNLEPVNSIWKSIGQNALSAAFHDSRFRPLTSSELDKVHIDISILTEPEPLNYRDAEDLAGQLRPGIDGVILSCGRSGATFLPQVWDQLPTVELFLGHLCRKAGLSENCWLHDHPEIQTYQVKSFSEDTP